MAMTKEEFIRKAICEVGDGLSFMDLFDEGERYEANEEFYEKVTVASALESDDVFYGLVEVLDDLASFMESFSEGDEESHDRWEAKVDLLNELSKIKR